MKSLHQLLDKLDYRLIKGSLDTKVTDIFYDSRKVAPDTMFVCMVGSLSDGHEYIPDAVKKGASVVVMEREIEVDADVTVVYVESARKALSYM